MKFFSKNELLGILIIFIVLAGISAPNFVASWQRSRDATRKDDLFYVMKLLEAYTEPGRKFPLSSSDGRIIACFKTGEEAKYDNKGNIVNFIPCEWGQDSFMGKLPIDPQGAKGVAYFYISDGDRYQIYGSLERSDQDEYDTKVVKRNIICGNRVCNFGRGYSNTPVDISIEEFEAQTNAKK